MRRSIAAHMVRSLQTAPHVTTVMAANLAPVVGHRAANQENLALRGIKLTFTAYISEVVHLLENWPH